MKTSNKGLVELVGHEGVCLSKYKDSVGVWTIGIGATRTEIPDIASWPLDKKITMQEAFELLNKSIVKYENAINKNLTRPIAQYEFDALVSWCYNVGTGWVSKSTLMKRINARERGQTLADALLMYRRPPEIVGRRKKEAKLLSTGIYSNEGLALLFPVSSRGYPVYGKGKPINVWEYIESKSEEQPVPKPVPKAEEKALETKPNIFKNIIDWWKGK